MTLYNNFISNKSFLQAWSMSHHFQTAVPVSLYFKVYKTGT